VDRVAEVFGNRAAVLLPDENRRVSVAVGDGSLFGGGEHERAVAQWAFDNGQMAGPGTPSLPAARGVYVPLVGAERSLGVLAVQASGPQPLREPGPFQLLRAFANQAALALERCQLAEAAAEARTLAETERTRSALLSSVSHDLRTPLAAITGAATSLRDDARALPEATRRDLADTIAEEAQRLNRLIGDLLEMTRLESGALRVRKDWHSLEEVVGAALVRLEARLGDRPVVTRIPGDLPLVPARRRPLRAGGVEPGRERRQVLAPGEAIELDAAVAGGELRLAVADRGPGLRRRGAARVREVLPWPRHLPPPARRTGPGHLPRHRRGPRRPHRRRQPPRRRRHLHRVAAARRRAAAVADEAPGEAPR